MNFSHFVLFYGFECSSQYSQLSLSLYKTRGETEPERVILQHRQLDCSTPILLTRKQTNVSIVSAESIGSAGTRASKVSRASAKSSAASTRIVSSRHDSTKRLRRNGTDSWLKAIHASPKGSTQSLLPDNSQSVLPSIPGSPAIPWRSAGEEFMYVHDVFFSQ